jgi:hypothetical protein
METIKDTVITIAFKDGQETTVTLDIDATYSHVKVALTQADALALGKKLVNASKARV